MIDVKEAVASARSHFNEVFGAPAGGVTLEEVELTDDEKFWLVTFGYDRPATAGSLLAQIAGTVERVFKTVKVDATDGRAWAIKHRRL